MFTADPAEALRRGEAFLHQRPVEHNLILTLLQARVRTPEDGRYWLIEDDGAIAGVVFQSPLTFSATLTPMAGEAVAAAVDEMARSAPDLPGVIGDAPTASVFAGRWTEVRKKGAHPSAGQRLYQLDDLSEPEGVPGALRLAVEEDVPVLTEWMRGFLEETGERPTDPTRMVQARVDAEQFFVWDHHGPMATAAASVPVADVTRVQAVYTPPHNRERGYAGATVGAISRRSLDRGLRCVLYTELANPVSNSVYRRLGYRAVAEILRYAFEG